MGTKKLAAIGALRIRWFALPLFMMHGGGALNTAKDAPGCVFAGTNFHEGKAFSLTVWESPAHMKTYVHGKLHGRAMRWSWLTSKVLRFHHFTVETPPSWDEAISRWQEAG